VSAESDLLRVVLALQMGFVTKEQVVEWGRSGLRKREKPLVDLLSGEKGYLKPRARKALDSLAEARR